MATRGQTHNKRARELALREKRERKALKKEERALGIYPTDETEVDGEGDGESESDADAPVGEEQVEEATETVAESIQ